MQLDEDLGISERLVDAGGTAYAVDDHFRTRNSFYGGQVGARAEWEKGRYFANGQLLSIKSTGAANVLDEALDYLVKNYGTPPKS